MNPAKLSQALQDSISACVVDKWMRLKSARREKENFWQECDLAMECKFGATWGEIEDNRSHRYIPIGFQTVETAVAQYLQGTVPNDRFFKAQGRTPTDQKKAGPLESKIRWDMYRTNWRTSYQQFLKSAAVRGNVPWTIVWRTERTPSPDQGAMQAIEEANETIPDEEGNKEFADAMDDAGVGYASTMKTSFEGAQLVVGDLYNFVIDRAPDDPKHAFRIYRTLQTSAFIRSEWKDLKDDQGRPIYQHIDELHDGECDYMESSDSLKRVIDSSLGFQPMVKDRVELLTFCGDLVLSGDYGQGSDQSKIYRNVFGVIANRRWVLRFGTNPNAHGLPPWQMFSLIQDPIDPYGYGRGVIEPILGIQDMVNVRANQAADANALAINPPLSVVADGITNTRQIVWGPGEILYMRNPQSIMPMTVPKDALSLALQEINFYTGQAGLTSGVQSQAPGAAGYGSATEAQGAQSMGTARMTEALRHIESAALVPMIRMMASLNQQLMDPENPVIVRLFMDDSGSITDPYTGEPMDPRMSWATVPFDQIQGEFDFEILGANAANQSQQQVRDKIQLYGQISQDPALKAYLRPGPFLKSLLENSKWPDAHQFIKSEMEVQNDMAQQAALQQQQPMGDAGNAGAQGGSGGQPGHRGVPSVPGNAGGGGDAARTPYPEQLDGPSGAA